MTHPSQESEMPEPLTSKEEAELRATLDRLLANSGYLTGCEQMNARLLATLDAAREQAATETRRELLAKVEGLPEDDWMWHAGIEYIAASAVMGIFEDAEMKVEGAP